MKELKDILSIRNIIIILLLCILIYIILYYKTKNYFTDLSSNIINVSGTPAVATISTAGIGDITIVSDKKQSSSMTSIPATPKASVTSTVSTTSEKIMTTPQINIDVEELRKINPVNKCLTTKYDSIVNQLPVMINNLNNNLNTKSLVESILDVLLNKTTYNSISSIVSTLKTINNDDIKCLFINDNAPFIDLCRNAKYINILDNEITQIQKVKDIFALYNKELIDIKNIILPNIITYIKLCNNIDIPTKIKMLQIIIEILTNLDYIGYIIGGNKDLINNTNNIINTLKTLQ